MPQVTPQTVLGSQESLQAPGHPTDSPGVTGEPAGPRSPPQTVLGHRRACGPQVTPQTVRGSQESLRASGHPQTVRGSQESL